METQQINQMFGKYNDSKDVEPNNIKDASVWHLCDVLSGKVKSENFSPSEAQEELAQRGL